jgi:hypothetical protein
MKNPWLPEFWNLTEQGAYITRYGLAQAQLRAAEAGTTVGGKPKHAAVERVMERRWTNTRKIVEVATGPRGFSGNGPPES